ncbi:armadillo-type protein [Gongronella butleri]|nr:armadillo-type protein [Gongronella butleri]
MDEWQPQPEGLGELVLFLRDASHPHNTDRADIQQRLDSFRAVPDYNCYLAFILVRLRHEAVVTRQIAGLTLKNNLKSDFYKLSADVLGYVKQCCVHALSAPDPDARIRSVIGSVVAAIYTTGQPSAWPALLDQLMQMMDSTNASDVEMASDAVGKICEDGARDLNQDLDGDRPLNRLLPKLIVAMQHPQGLIRVQSVVSISQFIFLKPLALMIHMNAYLRGLLALMADPDATMRQEVCSSLTMLLETRPDKLAPVMDTILAYMLHCSADAHDAVVLRACDFWAQLVGKGDDAMRARVVPLIDTLLVALLPRLAYSEMDLFSLKGDDEDDAHRFYHQRNGSHRRTNSNHVDADDDHSPEDESDDDDDDDDDDELYSEWTVRQVCASTLELLAKAYPDRVCATTLAYIDSAAVHANWLVRESSLLALGVLAEGAARVIQPTLPNYMPMVLNSLQDIKPLVRSVGCWVLGRYAYWAVEQVDAGQGAAFDAMVQQLVRMMMDANPRVQVHACVALTALEEAAGARVVPYLETLVPAMVMAFDCYPTKNLEALCDVLDALAEAAGHALNQEHYFAALMPPLTYKWNALADTDTQLFPLFQCLSTVIAIFGSRFQDHVGPVYGRCVQIIATTWQANHDTSVADPPDMGLVVASLDLISGMVQGQRTNLGPIIHDTKPNLLSLLPPCLQEHRMDVVQAACALVGDLAATRCYEALGTQLGHVVPLILRVMASADGDRRLACSNATWALGEMVVAWPTAFQEDANSIIDQLLHLFRVTAPPSSNSEATNASRDRASTSSSLAINVAIALGRMGFAAPDVLAKHLKRYTRAWLLRIDPLPYDHEKASAMAGFGLALRINPVAVQKEYGRLLKMIVNWPGPSDELAGQFHWMVLSMKRGVSASQWDRLMYKVVSEQGKQLLQRYGSND